MAGEPCGDCMLVRPHRCPRHERRPARRAVIPTPDATAPDADDMTTAYMIGFEKGKDALRAKNEGLRTEKAPTPAIDLKRLKESIRVVAPGIVASRGSAYVGWLAAALAAEYDRLAALDAAGTKVTKPDPCEFPRQADGTVTWFTVCSVHENKYPCRERLRDDGYFETCAWCVKAGRPCGSDHK